MSHSVQCPGRIYDAAASEIILLLDRADAECTTAAFRQARQLSK
jgi:hypothetical protein